MSDVKNNSILLPDEVIMTKIFVVRGQKVMIDRDLAELYEVKAIRLREQVKRNIDKFPVHFMFQLTVDEVEIMVSQNAIPSKQHLGGLLPYVFTEHGVLHTPQPPSAIAIERGARKLQTCRLVHLG